MTRLAIPFVAWAVAIFLTGAADAAPKSREAKPEYPPVEWPVIFSGQADRLAIKEWLKFKTVDVARWSDVIGGGAFEDAMRRRIGQRFIFERVFIVGTTSLSNSFGAKSEGVRVYAPSSFRGKATVQPFTVASDGFSDQRLVARIADRKCLDENSVEALYTNLVTRLLFGMERFTDSGIAARAKSPGMPTSPCQFKIRATIYKASNFYGLKRVLEFEEP